MFIKVLYIFCRVLYDNYICIDLDDFYAVHYAAHYVVQVYSFIGFRSSKREIKERFKWQIGKNTTLSV